VEGFPFVHYETARFSDLDGMGHVNNAVFSVYVEQARLAWFGRYAGDEPMPLKDVILARTEIDFRAQVGFGETVAIGVRPSRVGRKSFELEFELRVGDRLVAESRASWSATTTPPGAASRSRNAGAGDCNPRAPNTRARLGVESSVSRVCDRSRFASAWCGRKDSV
jgi:acyl-CoA thioester hydrolase